MFVQCVELDSISGVIVTQTSCFRRQEEVEMNDIGQFRWEISTQELASAVAPRSLFWPISALSRCANMPRLRRWNLLWSFAASTTARGASR